MTQISRRNFCAVAGGAVASLALGSACKTSRWSSIPNDGRLTARPRNVTNSSSATGQISLGLDRDRDAILQLPKSQTSSPLPLLMFLHGAGQVAEDMFWYLGEAPDEAGLAVLVPHSRDETWDAISGGSFSANVEFLNRALERVFETVAVDPARIAIGGFSDGASYAISLGLINGDLFNRVSAFSPGFVISGANYGKPHFFISHGTHDHILPIDRCGRRIAAGLTARGYNVRFREFDGDHEIPAHVVREGLQWVVAKA